MTAIEWTHRPGTKGETWNPVRGCTRKSEGCRNCYAEALAAALHAAPGQLYHGLVEQTPGGPRWTGAIACDEEKLRKPLGWRDDCPRTCFVNSMGDLFHEKVPTPFIDKVIAAVALKGAHVFIVLTKRDERQRDYFQDPDTPRRIAAAAVALGAGRLDAVIADVVLWGDARTASGADEALPPIGPVGLHPWPLPNLWLGVSAEDQPTFDARWPSLRDTPAAVRVLSLEPLIGPIIARAALGCAPTADWILIGGESARRGQRARPMHPAWAADLLSQCRAAGVPHFFKQIGQWTPLGPVPWDPAGVAALGRPFSDGCGPDPDDAPGQPPQAYTGALDMRRLGWFDHATAIMDVDGRDFDDVETAAAEGNNAWLFAHTADAHVREFDGRRYEQWPAPPANAVRASAS